MHPGYAGRYAADTDIYLTSPFIYKTYVLRGKLC